MTEEKKKDPRNKRDAKIILVLVAIIGIPTLIVALLTSNKPEWQKKVDADVYKLQTEASPDAPMEYTRSIYALLLIHGVNDVDENGVTWGEYYKYLTSRTYYTCQQIPGTTPSEDLAAKDFVACKHM